MQEITLWSSTNLSTPDRKVLAGSDSTMTEMTGCTYLSLPKPSPEVVDENEKIIVPIIALTAFFLSWVSNRFCET